MALILNYTLLYPWIAFVVILAVTWLVTHFLDSIIKRVTRGRSSVANKVKRLLVIVIWFFGIVFALEQLGLLVEILLLIVGLVGVAAIIASRDTLQNLFSKYFMDIYLTFDVGDNIKVREYSGRIIEMNPMSTILLTNDEQIVSVPNAIFYREITVNTTFQAWKEVSIPIVIDNDIGLPEFESEVIKSGNKFKHHLDERFPPMMAVKNREPKTTELVLTLMIKNPDMKEAITTEMNTRIAEIIERMKAKKKEVKW